MAASDILAQGTAHLCAGRLKAATSALGSDPDNVDAMQLCARIMRRSGRNEDAIGLYELIMFHAPENAEALGALS